MPKANGPHIAVVNIRCELYEQMHNGKATGLPVDTQSKLVIFRGKNREETEKQLTEFMESIDAKSEQEQEQENNEPVIEG